MDLNLLLEKPADVSANRPVDTLHKTAARIVCASAQAGGLRRILPLLTEDEEAVFKRGRNAHTGGIPKNQSSADYHYATGLESLFGWLYLKGMTGRINELYSELRRSDG